MVPAPDTRGGIEQNTSACGARSGARKIEELIDLPLMIDPAWRATMDVLKTSCRRLCSPTTICCRW